MAATIRDIAQKAGVSTATVSRYINSPERVSLKKGQLIAHAIKELDYTPNTIARSLITQQSDTLGVILPDISNYFYAPILRGIEDVAEQNDYTVFLCNTDQSLKKEKKYVDALLGRRVGGIMFIGARPLDRSKNQHIAALAKKMPLVMLYDDLPEYELCSIMTDEVMGSYKAVRFLIDLGHRDIALINSSAQFSTYDYKLKGYIQALEEEGILIREEYIVSQEEHEPGGYRAMYQLLELGKNRPTAVHAASDQMAIGAMRAAFENDLKVPRDLSVVGFSNSLISSQVYPKLTTIDQHGYQAGRMAAKKLIQLIAKQPVEIAKEIWEPEVVVRSSTSRR